MIFSGVRYQQVLSGTKTQTRRPCQPSDSWDTIQTESGLGRVKRDGRTHWGEGQRYAVQPGRAKFGGGYIRLVRIEKQCLGDLTEDDARAEGMASRAEFFEVWRTLYGKVDLNQLVWALTFELVRQ